MASTRHVYRIYVKAPIERVWSALVEPDFTRRYFHGTAFDTPPVAGQPYRTSMVDGSPAVDGQIEVIEPPHTLVMTWHTLYDAAMAEEPPSRVEWSLTVAGDNLTQVDLTHGDLFRSPLTWAQVKDGWVWILDGMKTLLETGEELSSPGLQAFCEQHKAWLKSDVLIASDGPRLSAKRPTLYLGSRGCMNLNFTLELREGAHHSGNWGGLLANPGIILMHALSSIVTREGKVLVRELLPQNIPASVRNALKDCTPTPEPDEPQIDPWWGEPGLTAAEKVYAWNTFEILAFRTGNPDNPVNAIPGHAVATCQIRFVAGTDAETFIPILRKHLDANGYDGVKIGMARKSFMQATRLDPDNAWVRWAAESIRRSTGAAPAILPNIGGSLPNDCFAETLGLPTLWVPHSYAGCSQHAPNEHALGSILREGLQMMTGLFWDLAEDGVPAVQR